MGKTSVLRQEAAGFGRGFAGGPVPATVQKADAEREEVPPAVLGQGDAVRRGHCHQEPGTTQWRNALVTLSCILSRPFFFFTFFFTFLLCERGEFVFACFCVGGSRGYCR